MRSIATLELDGGCLAFDFVNTISNRNIPFFHEYLNHYDDFLEWSKRAGVLSKARAGSIAEFALHHQKLAQKSFIEVIRIREVLFAMLSATACGKKPAEKDIEQFNQILSRTLSNLKLEIDRGKVNISFAQPDQVLEEPLFIIVKNAFDVLTGEDMSRIKECPNCGWLFLDRTKNGKRRWCNMQVCGSRDKSHRYYLKNRTTSK